MRILTVLVDVLMVRWSVGERVCTRETWSTTVRAFRYTIDLLNLPRKTFEMYTWYTVFNLKYFLNKKPLNIKNKLKLKAICRRESTRVCAPVVR